MYRKQIPLVVNSNDNATISINLCIIGTPVSFSQKVHQVERRVIDSSLDSIERHYAPSGSLIFLNQGHPISRVSHHRQQYRTDDFVYQLLLPQKGVGDLGVVASVISDTLFSIKLNFNDGALCWDHLLNVLLNFNIIG